MMRVMTFQTAARLFVLGCLSCSGAMGDDRPPAPPVAVVVEGAPPRRGVQRRLARRPSYLTVTRDQVLEQINSYRSRQMRPAVVVNPELQAAAQSFAEHMARTAVFSHTADGRQPSMRASQAGYESMMVTENIAYQGPTGNLSQSLVNMWIGSPSHHANLMRPDLTETGVGVAQSPYNGQFYAVQLFGRPAARRFQVQVRNTTREVQTYKVGRHEYSLGPNMVRTHSLGRRTEVALAAAGNAEDAVRADSSGKFDIRETDEDELLLVKNEPTEKIGSGS
jgi:uncharacterized protein YkwD